MLNLDVLAITAMGGAFSTTYWIDPKEKIVVLLYRQMWGSHSEIEGIQGVSLSGNC